MTLPKYIIVPEAGAWVVKAQMPWGALWDVPDRPTFNSRGAADAYADRLRREDSEAANSNWQPLGDLVSGIAYKLRGTR